MEDKIPLRLAALGHPTRLAVFRLLMRRYPDRVPAGDIAAALDLRPSTLSSHLSSLTQADLVAQNRVSTSIRYTINMETVRGTFDGLLLECCRGRPELCASNLPLSTQVPPNGSKTRFNALFICVGNSARSIFAETLLRDLGGDQFNVFSAGTSPFSVLNPHAVAQLKAKGHEVSTLKSQHIDEFRGADAPTMDFVFTVCDTAANEECPPWEGQPISAHWGIPDPVKATGTDAEISLAFQTAYGELRNRILAFTALPLRTLDRISLQKAVDDLAH